MPSDVAIEKSDLLEKLGAIVEKVRPAPITDRNHFVNLAKRRAEEHTEDAEKPGRGIFADQFENEANWKAHFEGMYWNESFSSNHLTESRSSGPRQHLEREFSLFNWQLLHDRFLVLW